MFKHVVEFGDIVRQVALAIVVGTVALVLTGHLPIGAAADETPAAAIEYSEVHFPAREQ